MDAAGRTTVEPVGEPRQAASELSRSRKARGNPDSPRPAGHPFGIDRDDLDRMSVTEFNGFLASQGLDWWVVGPERVVDPATRCTSLEMFPYDDGYDANGQPDFGYQDWRCHRRAGHDGDHAGWDPKYDRAALAGSR